MFQSLGSSLPKTQEASLVQTGLAGLQEFAQGGDGIAEPGFVAFVVQDQFTRFHVAPRWAVLGHQRLPSGKIKALGLLALPVVAIGRKAEF